MLNPVSFLLARILAGREGVDDSRANQLALTMGVADINPAAGALVAQQTARCEVSAAQTAAQYAELKATVDSMRTMLAGVQQTVALLETSLVEIPQQFDDPTPEAIQARLAALGFPHATVTFEPCAEFDAGRVLRIKVADQAVEGEDLVNLRLIPWVPFTLVVSSRPTR